MKYPYLVFVNKNNEWQFHHLNEYTLREDFHEVYKIRATEIVFEEQEPITNMSVGDTIFIARDESTSIRGYVSRLEVFIGRYDYLASLYKYTLDFKEINE